MSARDCHQIDKGKYFGIERGHHPSRVQKLVFFLLHGFTVGCSAYLLGGGFLEVGNWFGESWEVVDFWRGFVLWLASFFYFVRMGITLFYLLQRRVGWGEVFMLSLFISFFEISACAVGSGIFRSCSIPLNEMDWLAIGLVLLGSFLNTYSELQRKWWKQEPANQGRCYTKGLFAFSRHINYFGDNVLFTGWCLLTANFWFLIVPILMAISFLFYHIPSLESYLEERYGEEFREYAQRTKKFIPFIY